MPSAALTWQRVAFALCLTGLCAVAECAWAFVGALVLGAKTNGEPYAPDESAAIAQVAHGVGIALDLLGAKTARENGEVLVSLRSLEALSLATNEALQSLPDAIAEKLRGLSVDNEQRPL